MKTPPLHKSVCFAVLLLTLLNACNAQSKRADESVSRAIAKGELKMKKTQGSNEYENVHCGLQDKKGNLWFGTTGEGVYCYDGKVFTQYTQKDGLSNNKVWCILEDRTGNIWFGTDAGVCCYNGKTIRYVQFSETGKNNVTDSLPGNTNLYPKNTVWSMLQAKDGTIWLGTDNGLYCYNGNSFKQFLDTPQVANNTRLSLKNIQCMFQDTKGTIWFGSGPPAMEGIIKYDGKTIENFKPKNQGWIRNITETKDSCMVFTTRNSGICKYDGKSFSYMLPTGKIDASLLNGGFQDKAGNMWLGMDYGTELNDTVGGVWRYDGKLLTKFSTKDGLTNNAVFLILQDKDGNIWVGTRNVGLYRFNGVGFTSFSE